MEWQQTFDHPRLRDLPFMVEANKRGHLRLTPAANEHGLYQARIVQWLPKLGRRGHLVSECGVLTGGSVKEADVARAGNARKPPNDEKST